MRYRTFQSTRPRGARHPDAMSVRTVAGFNPRARVGRDQEQVDAGLHSSQVSIHAPAWGATPRWTRRARRTSRCFNPRARVGRDSSTPNFAPPPSRSFNPRARVGRDLGAVDALHDALRFQSTRPRGARPARQAQRLIGLDVSIHAPAWGATDNSRRTAPSADCFNPRARVGRDIVISRRLVAPPSFNPRARVGRDCARNACRA